MSQELERQVLNTVKAAGVIGLPELAINLDKGARVEYIRVDDDFRFFVLNLIADNKLELTPDWKLKWPAKH